MEDIESTDLPTDRLDLLVTTPLADTENAASEAKNCIKRGGGHYFRRFSRAPKHCKIGSKIFYVDDGYITGYAVVNSINQEVSDIKCDTTGRVFKPGCVVLMRADSWKWIEPIKCSGFQGFRYYSNPSIIVIGNWLDPKPNIR